jgi:hypothetical protein
LERVSRVEAETSRKNAEGFSRMIALLEDEIVVEHWAREVSERERRE